METEDNLDNKQKHDGKLIFEFLFKVFETPLLFLVALVISLFHLAFGLIVVPGQFFRYFGAKFLADLDLLSKNEKPTSVFSDAFYEFLEKYFLFFERAFSLPFAIWREEKSKISLQSILEYENEVLSKSWPKTILIFASMTISFGITLALLNKKATSGENSQPSEVENLILAAQRDSLLVQSQMIDYLSDSIKKLNTKAASIIQAAALVEPPHPYGKGNGRVSIYSHCSTCGDIQVFIDGNKIGKLTGYFKDKNYRPDCEQEGVLFITLTAGYHKIRAKDLDDGATWEEKDVFIAEDICTPYGFSE